jgi:hypothetical protein
MSLSYLRRQMHGITFEPVSIGSYSSRCAMTQLERKPGADWPSSFAHLQCAARSISFRRLSAIAIHGASWPDAISGLGDVLAYDLKEVKPGDEKRVRALMALLSPKDFDSRVQLLVTEMPWGYLYDQSLDFVLAKQSSNLSMTYSKSPPNSRKL